MALSIPNQRQWFASHDSTVFTEISLQKILLDNNQLFGGLFHISKELILILIGAIGSNIALKLFNSLLLGGHMGKFELQRMSGMRLTDNYEYFVSKLSVRGRSYE